MTRDEADLIADMAKLGFTCGTLSAVYRHRRDGVALRDLHPLCHQVYLEHAREASRPRMKARSRADIQLKLMHPGDYAAIRAEVGRELEIRRQAEPDRPRRYWHDKARNVALRRLARAHPVDFARLLSVEKVIITMEEDQ